MNPPAVIFHKQLGDVLLLEPALAKLSASYGQNVVLSTRLKFEPMVRLMRNVDMAGLLPTHGVSRVISFSPRPRAAVKTLLTQCDSKVAIFKDPSGIQWWHRFIYMSGCPVVPDSGEYKAKYLYRVMPCDTILPYRPPRLISPPEEWKPKSLEGNYILLHATSAWKRKTWSAQKWAAVLDKLHDSGMGPFVCTSGPVSWEIEFVNSIQKASRALIINFAGKTSLESYLWLVANANLVLCIDSSATHLAAAFQRPSVTLFGPTNPKEWHYSSERARLIDARQFTDSPAPKTDVIPVEAVCKTALSLLEATTIAHPAPKEPVLTIPSDAASLSSRRRRILYVYSGKANPSKAGLDFVALQQLRALTDAGYSVTFVSRGRYDHKYAENVSLPLTPANLFSFLPAKYYYSLQSRFFSKLGASILRRRQFDAVIGWEGGSKALFEAGRFRNVPCLLNCPMIHASAQQSRAATKSPRWPVISESDSVDEYEAATLLMTASDYAAKSFLEQGVAANKIINITRGADISRFSRQAAESKEGAGQPFRAVFYGRICNRKGIIQTLEAWRSAAISNAELWIIGAIDREIADAFYSNLAPNVRYFGYVRDAETLLPQCHVQILPTEAEGMAKTLIEGASCGCVSLATKESGFPIIEGKTGFYIERENIKMIAANLRFLASENCDLEGMREASSDFVQNKLTWTHFSEKFLRGVNQAIRNPSPA
jgi:glycosyltransferase involved in cell wall biosynthesis